MKLKLIIAIKRFYLAIQKPLAFVCILIAVLANVFGLTALQRGAILGIGFVILQILFDIHSELVQPQWAKPKVYNNYSKAFIEMERIIDDQVKRKKTISLKWLGTCMDVGWLFLSQYLKKAISEELDVSIDIEIIMLSPDWSEFDKVNPFWKTETKSKIESIQDFINQHSGNKINIKLFTYKQMPYYTGLLINNKYLFLGLCEWDKDKYGVLDNVYTLYLRDSDPEDQKFINQYDSWFSFYSGTAIKTDN
ncbi:MAG: hypothetical protein F6K62_09045 [Sphaerospermopsis sp. SIO1G2]|nr:hypothetical protein [Sphaerospermopsis sp. SIO1G1]NET71066.1 hypothetical protein [Sphaerospermopsis sp. SIO1G2]